MKLGNKNLNMVRLFTALFIISVAGLALAKPHINAVKVQKVSDGVNVVVSGQDLSTPNRYQIKANYSIIEFKAGLTGKGQFVRARTVTTKWVKYGWYRAHPPIVRVLICTKPGSKLVVTKDDATNNFVIKTVTKAAVDTQYIRPIITRMAAVAPVTGDETVTVNPVTETLTTPVTETAKTVTPTTTVNVTKTKPNYYVATTNTKPTTTEIAGLTGNTTFTNRRVLKPTTGIARVSPVSLDFVNADIGNVLKALAIQTGANIVTSPDVKGTVTVSLSGVTVDNALDLITKLSNLKYAKIENTYIVGTPGTINAMAPMMTDVAANVKPSLVVDVVRVQYGDLKAIGSAVSEVMKDIAAQEGFKVIDGASSGSGSSSSSDGKMGDQRIERYLILTGSIKAVAIGKQVAIDLDRQFAEACAAGQVMEVFHARHTDAIKLKAALEGQIQMAMGSSGSSSGSSSSGGDTGNKAFPLFPVVRISIGPNPAVSSHDVMATETSESNSSSSGGSSSSSGSTTIEPPMTLVFQGPAAEVAKAIAFAKVLDAPPPQVQIEAKVVDINIDDMKKWGLDWDFLNSSTVNDAPGQSKFSGTIPAGTDPLTSASFTISKFFNDFRYTVKIDAMLRNYNAKILASPRVSVLDSRYAQIFIGDEVKYVESISQTPTGQNITIGTVKAGIQLNVAPRISPEDGTITMNIHPEVSMIYDYLEVPGGGSLPQIARRYADTTIRVKDGETIVIGGLIREDDLKTVKKVPLLGELPLLGYLFTNYKLNKTRNEIVIFITPRIVKD